MLTGKNAVVTGALQGIGRATVDYFASMGANVWACALSPTDEFEAHCKEVSEKYGVWVKPVYFNLLNQDEIKAAVKTIQSEKVPVDILVNIAGMTKDALFQMVSMDTLHQIFEVNYFSQNSRGDRRLTIHRRRYHITIGNKKNSNRDSRGDRRLTIVDKLDGEKIYFDNYYDRFFTGDFLNQIAMGFGGIPFPR